MVPLLTVFAGAVGQSSQLRSTWRAGAGHSIYSNPRAAPGASPVCLSRRSSCGSSWLISTAAAAAAPTQALQSSVSKQEQIQFLGAAHLGAPCSSWTLMLDGSPANSALLICPTKGTPKPQPVSAFPLPCALTCLRTSVPLNLEEGTKQRGRVICPCSGQRTDFWLGWGGEEKTTGVLTVINWAKCESFGTRFDTRHRLLPPPLPLFYCCTLLW